MLTARTAEDDRAARLRDRRRRLRRQAVQPARGRRARAGAAAASRRRREPRAGAVTMARWRSIPVRREVRVGGQPVPADARPNSRCSRRWPAHPGRTFTREELVARAFGPDYEGLDRTIDTHVTNLRRKLECGGRRRARCHGARHRLPARRIGTRPDETVAADAPAARSRRLAVAAVGRGARRPARRAARVPALRRRSSAARRRRALPALARRLAGELDGRCCDAARRRGLAAAVRRRGPGGWTRTAPLSRPAGAADRPGTRSDGTPRQGRASAVEESPADDGPRVSQTKLQSPRQRQMPLASRRRPRRLALRACRLAGRRRRWSPEVAFFGALDRRLLLAAAIVGAC